MSMGAVGEEIENINVTPLKDVFLVLLVIMIWITRNLGWHVGQALLYPITLWFYACSSTARLASRDYLARVLGHPAFRTGELHTGFVEQHEAELRAFGRGFAWLAIVPVLLHGAWILFRRRGTEALNATRGVLFALVASAVATLGLYLGDTRLRVPFDPLILTLAADAWLSLANAVLRIVPRLFRTLFRAWRAARTAARSSASPLAPPVH